MSHSNGDSLTKETALPEPDRTGKPVRASRRSRRSLGETLIVAAVLVYAGVLLAGPLAAIAWSSFSAGTGEFFRQITSPDAISAMELTLLLAVSATAINTVFGVVVAFVLVRDRFTGQRILNAFVDLPFAVSPVIAGFMLILLFGRNGWFEPVTTVLGVKIVFATPGMLIATTFVSLPFVIREVMPVLLQIGLNEEHAAYSMGAGPIRTFWHVTLPSIRWGLLYGVSLSFARAVGEIGAVLVVSGGVSRLTETSTLFIFRSLDDRNYVGSYAMALLLAVFTYVVMALMKLVKRRPETAER